MYQTKEILSDEKVLEEILLDEKAVTYEQKDYDYIVTPYQERIAEILKLPYPIFWFVFSIVLFVIHSSILTKCNELPGNIWPLISATFLPFLIATGIIWLSKTLEDFTPSIFKFISWPTDKIIPWYENEIRSIFNDKRMAISGLAFSVIMVPTTHLGSLWPTNILARLSYLSISMVANFLTGGMIYVMIRILIMVYRMSKIDDIKVSVNQHSVTSVKAVGKLMFRLSFMIIVIYIFDISCHFGDKLSTFTLFKTSSFGLFVLSFLFYPQLNVHKMMAKAKHRKLMNFSTYLEDSLQAVTEDPSAGNIQRIRELLEIHRSLNGMGE